MVISASSAVHSGGPDSGRRDGRGRPRVGEPAGLEAPAQPVEQQIVLVRVVVVAGPGDHQGLQGRIGRVRIRPWPRLARACRHGRYATVRSARRAASRAVSSATRPRSRAVRMRAIARTRSALPPCAIPAKTQPLRVSSPSTGRIASWHLDEVLDAVDEQAGAAVGGQKEMAIGVGRRLGLSQAQEPGEVENRQGDTAEIDEPRQHRARRGRPVQVRQRQDLAHLRLGQGAGRACHIEQKVGDGRRQAQGPSLRTKRRDNATRRP